MLGSGPDVSLLYTTGARITPGFQPLWELRKTRTAATIELFYGASAAMTQKKTMVSTKEAPAAIGPYSQAVRVGEFVFTSGQVGLDPATGKLVEGGIKAQTTRVLENLKAVLAAAGLDMAQVVKTTVFLRDMGDFAAMNEVYAQYLAAEGVVAPARSTVAVAGLPKDALVEIELIAKDS
jgi:2-iminobutanoate/2-iminopropanoate deaminase